MVVLRTGSRSQPNNNNNNYTQPRQPLAFLVHLGIGTCEAKMARFPCDLSFLAAKLELMTAHDSSMTNRCSFLDIVFALRTLDAAAVP